MYEYLTVQEVRDLLNAPDYPAVWVRIQFMTEGQVSWVQLRHTLVMAHLDEEQPQSMTRFYEDMDDDLVIDGMTEVKEAEE